MTRCVPYQYIPLARERLLPRLINRAWSTGAAVILDLEDSIQDPLDPPRNSRLKEDARRLLERMVAGGSIERSTSPSGPARLGIRVNAPATNDFERDTRTLARIAQSTSFSWDFIIVPKIHSLVGIEGARDVFLSAGIRGSELIPLIETARGVDAMSGILASAAADRAADFPVRTAALGFFDLNLDLGRWPFLDQDSEEYWDVVARFQGVCGEHGIRYLHTPSPLLADEQAFSRMIWRLSELASDGFDLQCISAAQAKWCAGPVKIADGGAPVSAPTLAHKKLLAEETVEAFTTKHRPTEGFVVSRETGMFMPPHQYFAAVRYLQDLSEAARVGIAGGCLAAASGVALSETYQKVMLSRLREESPEVRLRFVLGHYASPEGASDEVLRLIKERGADIILFQVRPGMYLDGSKLATRKMRDSLRGRKPGSASRKMVPAVARSVASDSVYNTRKGFAAGILRDANSALGALLGRRRRASRRMLRMLDEVAKVCKEKRADLVVVGPLPLQISLTLRKQCRLLDREMERRAADLGLPYVSACIEGLDAPESFHPDGLHLNAAGHDHVARATYPYLKEAQKSSTP